MPKKRLGISLVISLYIIKELFLWIHCNMFWFRHRAANIVLNQLYFSFRSVIHTCKTRNKLFKVSKALMIIPLLDWIDQPIAILADIKVIKNFQDFSPAISRRFVFKLSLSFDRNVGLAIFSPLLLEKYILAARSSLSLLSKFPSAKLTTTSSSVR